MKKRIIAAALCVVFALASGLSGLFCLQTDTKKLIGMLESAQTAFIKGEDASEYIASAQEFWRKRSRFLGIMLKHEDVDELERCFIRLEDHYNSGNDDETREALTDCRAALLVVLDGEYPRPDNIF